MDVGGLETPDPAPCRGCSAVSVKPAGQPRPARIALCQVWCFFFFLKRLSATGEPVKEEEGKSLSAR